MPVLNFDSDEERQRDLEHRLDGEHVLAGPVLVEGSNLLPEGQSSEAPQGWKSFTTALPPNLYARLAARAEGEGVDVLTETAYLLAYALDNCPRPSEAHLEPLSEDEQTEVQAVKTRLRAAICERFGRE